MAIFYEHIKGYYKDSGNGLWSWIKWVGSFTNGAVFANQPRLEIKNADVDGNPTGSAIDFGHLITEKGEGQQIIKPFKFADSSGNNPLTLTYNSITINDSFSINSATSTTRNFQLGNAIRFKSENASSAVTSGSAPNVFLGGVYFGNKAAFNGEVSFAQDVAFNSWVDFTQGIDVYRLADFRDDVSIAGVCEATSFNATSDYRAKKDIAQLDIQALPIIMDTPIYTFRYKNNDIPSVGVLAQDLAEINLTDDLTLVDNPKATGEDNDFMTVKESKLVYILWKAIQEQQKQINYLTDLVTRLSK